MMNFNKIKYIVLDVDGTLTDGGIYYDSQNQEIKKFNVKDGLGIIVGIAAGIEFIVLTGRKSIMVERRASELGIQHIFSGIQNKHAFLSGWMKEKGIESESICYIGDDLNDLRCMEISGIKMCPNDAAEEVKKICGFVSKKNAGHGAVRECIEFILKNRCQWDRLVDELYR